MIAAGNVKGLLDQFFSWVQYRCQGVCFCDDRDDVDLVLKFPHELNVQRLKLKQIMMIWKQKKLIAMISNSLIQWLMVIDYTSKSEILTHQNQRLEIQTNLTFHWQQSTILQGPIVDVV